MNPKLLIIYVSFNLYGNLTFVIPEINSYVDQTIPYQMYMNPIVLAMILMFDLWHQNTGYVLEDMFTRQIMDSIILPFVLIVCNFVFWTPVAYTVARFKRG